MDWGQLLSNVARPAAQAVAARRDRTATEEKQRKQEELGKLARQRQSGLDAQLKAVQDANIRQSDAETLAAGTKGDITGHSIAQDGTIWNHHKDGSVSKAPLRDEAPEKPEAPSTPPSLGPSGPMLSPPPGMSPPPKSAAVNGPTGDIDLSRSDAPPQQQTGTNQPPKQTLPKFGPKERAPTKQALQKVVQPDGTVVFVDPTSPPPGLKERGPAPAQASFTFPQGVDAQGNPIFMRGNTRTGDLSPTDQGAKAPGMSGGKPTEAQEKSHLFYKLMENSQPQIDAAMKSGKVRKLAVSAYINSPDLVRPLVNSQLNAAEQSLIRSFGDFAAGVLRKESGAAVTHGELRDVWARFGPGFGDEPTLDAEKAKARTDYMETMKQQAGPAMDYYGARQGRGGGGPRTSGPGTSAAPAPTGLTPEQRQRAATDPEYKKYLQDTGKLPPGDD